LEKVVSDPYLLYLANKNMFKQKTNEIYLKQTLFQNYNCIEPIMVNMFTSYLQVRYFESSDNSKNENRVMTC